MSPNATNPVDQPDNSTKVSFSNDIEHAAPVDSYSRKTSTELRAAKDRQSLSASAKAWDIDGDGELDEAELALRALDKSHKGTLSKEQMYQLMNQSLTVERELGKVKKVVIGLVVFTCVLALANVGTSFAAAYLAKDTTTQEGKLVDSKTGDILAVNSAATVFTSDPDIARRRRKLCTTTTVGNGGNAVSSSTCETSDFTSLSVANGAALVAACESGGNAVLRKLFPNGASVDFPLCAIGTDDQATYSGRGQQAKSVTITKGNGNTISVAPDNANDATSYFVEGLSSALNQACGADSDCATGLVCDSNICKGDYGFTQCQSSTDCKADSTCGKGNLWPEPTFGTCHCTSSAGCGDGEMCEADCGTADLLPQCRTQVELDATCQEGETCTLGEYQSMCEGTTDPTYVILPVTEPAPVAKEAPADGVRN